MKHHWNLPSALVFICCMYASFSSVHAGTTGNATAGSVQETERVNITWPGGIVPYKFSKVYSQQSAVDRRHLVLAAMESIQNATCIRFVPQTTEKEYLVIVSGIACSSYVGKSGNGAQMLVLSLSDCFPNGTSGVAVHELMYSLGFQNEARRMDRDHYVDINWDNIPEHARSAFARYNFPPYQTSGPYDFGSILHIGMFDFAIQPDVWTIRPKAQYKDQEIGQRRGLSPLDIRKINSLYHCTE